MNCVRQWLAVAASILVFAGTARADLITGSVTSSTSASDYYSAQKASDGDITTEWVTTNYGDDYFASGGPSPVLTIDLGSTRNLAGFAYWGYGNSGNNTKTFSMAFSSDGVNYGSAIAYTTAAPRLQGTGSDRSNVYEQDWSFSTTTIARYAQMTITDSWCGGTCADGTACVGGDRVGFSDIQFRTSVVPEPTAIVMLITGIFGLLAYAWRKRK